ncbi:MAG: hypothetical protein KGZ63_00385 [Clostridiales bacterium]|jgi:hypothetical protein|nr:hypothetical protein [Clostridiales bacterium]
MQKKLTLSIDGELIEFAHEYAKKNQRSISAIVEEYFIQLRLLLLEKKKNLPGAPVSIMLRLKRRMAKRLLFLEEWYLEPKE